jgi:type III pantothenate kinase
MFIAVDIGNTHTVLGIYDSSRWIIEQRFPSSPAPDEIRLQKQISALFSSQHVELFKISGAGISSVVPSLTKMYQNALRSLMSSDTAFAPFIVSAEDAGIKTSYDDVHMLGSDRICSAVAGFSKYGGPLIVADLGTATTYDVVGPNGEFLGGVIAPGIQTSIDTLHNKTAQLPSIELALPKTVIGTNTIAGMQSGILYGAIDSFERMIQRIIDEMPDAKKEIPVVVTGGFAGFISRHSKLPMHVEPSLVLDGIRLIGERRRK